MKRIVYFCGALVSSAVMAIGNEPAVKFNRDIRPILSEHCFNCHGPDEQARQGGLRLDLRETALEGGDSGASAIVPGHPERSELIARVSAKALADLMPPPKQNNPLTTGQIAMLTSWIASGAEYEEHWAFIPPGRPAVPNESIPQNSAFKIRSPIDAFVLERLARENLAPSSEAPPATVIRRVSLDLTGLPPSPAETEKFKRDYAERGEAAYVELVDRLLDSASYAEKWARWWLDAARYADSDGYEKDLPREQWTWRDWVIQAFQRDLPYDQFIIEQIAGDLLPGATQDQRVATGFLRNGMVNEEGAIIAEEFRLEGMFDRLETIGKSVLGLTIQCAQCHTHKYDPISHDEYFQMFDFLNNTFDATSWVYSGEKLEQIERIDRQISEQEAAIKAHWPDWEERVAVWEEQMRSNMVEWELVDAIEHEWAGGLAHPNKLEDQSILTLGFRPTSGELWLTAITHATNLTGIRLEALTHGDLPYGGPGRSYKGTFALTEFYLDAAPLSVIGANTNHAAQIKEGWVRIPLTNAVADIEAPEQMIDPRFRRGDDDKRRVGPVSFLVDGSDETAWSTDLGPGRRNHDSTVVMSFATNDWASAEGALLRFTLKFRHGGDDGHGRHNSFLGRFRLALTTAENPQADLLSETIRNALRTSKSERTPEQEQLIFTHWRKSLPELSEFNERIEALWKDYPEGDSVLNLAERPPGMRRETFLLDRGEWNKPLRKVGAGVPAILHPLRETDEPGRLAFARWLVDPASPTSARVVVNRVWQSIFGGGLVESPEDFGVRSGAPSHPELLDWLAIEFMEGGLRANGEAPLNLRPWSMKQLIRAIVLSSTYRQDSKLTPELIERDPHNRLLARGPRFRAEAEMVRDIALSASGLLFEQVGGPSFYPPVPESLFAINFVKIDWKPAPPPERYRRSLYLFRRRSMPDPVMGSFDAPNADFSCVRRERSNTPMAALASLNEPVFVEAAQALSLRTLREAGSSDEERAAYAFQLCTGRAPNPAEVDAILDLLRSREARIAEGWLPARELAVGEAELPELPPGTNPRQLAAWTIVARVLLNLDETLTKN